MLRSGMIGLFAVGLAASVFAERDASACSAISPGQNAGVVTDFYFGAFLVPDPKSPVACEISHYPTCASAVGPRYSQGRKIFQVGIRLEREPPDAADARWLKDPSPTIVLKDATGTVVAQQTTGYSSANFETAEAKLATTACVATSSSLDGGANATVSEVCKAIDPTNLETGDAERSSYTAGVQQECEALGGGFRVLPDASVPDAYGSSGNQAADTDAHGANQGCNTSGGSGFAPLLGVAISLVLVARRRRRK